MDHFLKSKPLSISLILLNIILLVVIIILKSNNNMLISKYLDKSTINFETAAFIANDQKLSEKILLIDNKLDTIFLVSLFKKCPLLVIYYSENDCNTCFDQLQKGIFQTFRDLGYDKVLIIGEFNSIHNYISFVKNSSFPFNVLYLNEDLNDNLKTKSIDGLYTFILDDKGYKRSAFFPNSNLIRTMSYLEIVRKKYFEINRYQN
jgi:hypothetical protein